MLRRGIAAAAAGRLRPGPPPPPPPPATTTAAGLTAQVFIDLNWLERKLVQEAANRRAGSGGVAFDAAPLRAHVEAAATAALGKGPVSVMRMFSYYALSDARTTPYGLNTPRLMTEEGIAVRAWGSVQLGSWPPAAALAADVVHACAIRGDVDRGESLAFEANFGWSLGSKLAISPPAFLDLRPTDVVVVAAGSQQFFPALVRAAQHGRATAMATTAREWDNMIAGVSAEVRDVMAAPLLLDEALAAMVMPATEFRARAPPLGELAVALHAAIAGSPAHGIGAVFTGPELALLAASAGLLKDMRRSGASLRGLISSRADLFSFCPVDSDGASAGGAGGEGDGRGGAGAPGGKLWAAVARHPPVTAVIVQQPPPPPETVATAAATTTPVSGEPAAVADATASMGGASVAGTGGGRSTVQQPPPPPHGNARGDAAGDPEQTFAAGDAAPSAHEAAGHDSGDTPVAVGNATSGSSSSSGSSAALVGSDGARGSDETEPLRPLHVLEGDALHVEAVAVAVAELEAVAHAPASLLLATDEEEAVLDAVVEAGALHVSGDAPSAPPTAEDVAPSAVDSAREDSVAVAAMVAGEGEEAVAEMGEAVAQESVSAAHTQESVSAVLTEAAVADAAAASEASSSDATVGSPADGGDGEAEAAAAAAAAATAATVEHALEERTHFTALEGGEAATAAAATHSGGDGVGVVPGAATAAPARKRKRAAATGGATGAGAAPDSSSSSGGGGGGGGGAAVAVAAEPAAAAASPVVEGGDSDDALPRLLAAAHASGLLPDAKPKIANFRAMLAAAGVPTPGSSAKVDALRALVVAHAGAIAARVGGGGGG